ncbi:unnamed protein product [Polarella glacialis]|uniref:Uncharacterized protein n=1 Tax=Polarella glacialis TaxID=89957 RepID=A0A813JUF1_POLGL|nr:unnamed protein product [Polarella glacialis]
MACVPADHWFVASPIRLAVRILLGIGSMNHRHVALLNLAHTASYSCGNFASAQQVPGMQAGYGTAAACVLPEVDFRVRLGHPVFCGERSEEKPEGINPRGVGPERNIGLSGHAELILRCTG